MASTDATPIPVKNQAYRVTFPILDADGDLITGATGLDSEVSKDAGTFTDCTAEAIEIATASGMYYLDLTATEMNADTVAIIVKTTSSGAKTTPMILYPNKISGLAVNVTAWAGQATTTGDIAIKTTLAKTTHITGFNDISTAQVQTELGTYGALKPTTAGRTLDVTTTGEAGVDFDNTVGTLAKGTDITGFNDISAANVQTELTTYGALKPTVAARTLDVSATGEAGVDWANIGAPTTAQNLSGTTIATVGSVTNPVALTAAYDAAKTAASQVSVNTIDDFVDTEVSAIKVVTDKLDTALELDGAVYRYTTNALELAPTGSGGGGATVAQIWDEPIAGHLSAGSTGAKLNAAASAGDPWSTSLPGAYGAGTAGNILGNRVDVAVSTRATPAQVQTELGTYGALKPTTPGQTLDVSAGGEAGVDWANVGGKTTTNALTNTTIATVTTLTNAPPDSAGITTLLARIPAALFTGITSLAQWLGLIAGKQVGNTTARTELRATGAGGGTYDETTDSQEATRDRGDVAWITGGGGDPWATLLPGAYGVGTAGKILGTNLDATVSSRMPTSSYVAPDNAGVAAIKAKTDNLPPDPADASDVAASFATVNTKLDTVNAAIDTEIPAIKAKTDTIPVNPASVSDIPTALQNADALLKRDMAAVSGEASRSPLNALRLLRNKWSAVEIPSTLVVKKENDVDTAWTAPLTTDSAAAPITSMDPT